MINQRIAGHMQFLAFCLGRETFAVEVLKAREILDYIEPTEVPQMPAELLGVINLRGKVAPVIDLRRKFGMPSVARSRDNCIIILEATIEGEKTVVGAVADAVREVFTLNPDQIEPAPKLGTRLNSEFISGLGKRGDEFIILLDVDRVFAAGEFNMFQENSDDLIPAEISEKV